VGAVERRERAAELRSLLRSLSKSNLDGIMRGARSAAGKRPSARSRL
jgi:hypothetical protein